MKRRASPGLCLGRREFGGRGSLWVLRQWNNQAERWSSTARGSPKDARSKAAEKNCKGDLPCIDPNLLLAGTLDEPNT